MESLTWGDNSYMMITLPDDFVIQYTDATTLVESNIKSTCSLDKY